MPNTQHDERAYIPPRSSRFGYLRPSREEAAPMTGAGLRSFPGALCLPRPDSLSRLTSSTKKQDGTIVVAAFTARRNHSTVLL